jgi:hypothetical protein
MNHPTKRNRVSKAAAGRVLCATALVLAVASPAMAAPKCLPHTDIAKLLDARYSEGRVAGGVANGGGLIEVFSTGDGATWTIVVTNPQGVSCVLSAGEDWHSKSKLALGPQA